MRSKFEKRLFIGIPASKEIQPILFDIQSSIEYNPIQIRWVHPENIHMTLFFLGNVPLADIPKLTTALEEMLDLNHFSAYIKKTGVFSCAQNPKILWLGVYHDRQKIVKLYEWVEKNPIKKTPIISHSKWEDFKEKSFGFLGTIFLIVVGQILKIDSLFLLS